MTEVGMNAGEQSQQRLMAHSKGIEQSLAAIVGVITTIILVIGWGRQNPSIASFGDQFSAMVPSTATLLLLAAIALLLNGKTSENRYARRFRLAVGQAIIWIALGNLVIVLSGWAGGIDQVIWPDQAIFERERMSEATAISFLLLGWVLFRLKDSTAPQHEVIGFSTLGLVLAGLALIVFGFDARSLSSAALFSTMSLPTALAFLCLFLAVIFRLQRVGWLAILLADGPGSSALRRVLPLAVGLPLCFAFASHLAYRMGLYDETFQVSLLTLASAVLVIAILLKDARFSNISDAKNKMAMARLEAAEVEQQQLDRKRKDAELSAQAKTRFLANMSHEIRTPMNGILGFSELLLSEDMKPDHRRKIELIHESGQTMVKLLNSILDLSKIETGNFQIKQEVIDIQHIAKSSVRMFEASATGKGIDIDLTIADDVPKSVSGDGLRIKQVLTNIIGNAVKFTDHGRIDVALTTSGTEFAVSVADTGIGIAEADQSRVLGEFVQVEDGAERRHGGSGLGLHISKSLTELMGGTLCLTSKLGEGTCVTITLPISAQGDMSAAETTDRKAVPDAGASGWAGKRVAVAEDHDINQMLILEMLERLDADATMFANGAAAVDGIIAAKESGKPFDIVLMDIQMPVLNGIAAARTLRQRGVEADELPIVAMTANAFEADIEECLEAGMQAHLPKPLNFGSISKIFDARGQLSITQPAKGSIAA